MHSSMNLPVLIMIMHDVIKSVVRHLFGLGVSNKEGGRQVFVESQCDR